MGGNFLAARTAGRSSPSVVYFDTAAVSRLSDQLAAIRNPAAHTRVASEQAAVQRIVTGIVGGRVQLLSSWVLVAEVAQQRPPISLISAAVLALAYASVIDTPAIRSMARQLMARLGLHEPDALHIAAAYTGGATYAVSGDNHWLRRAAAVAGLLGPGPHIVAPEECVRREGL